MLRRLVCVLAVLAAATGGLVLAAGPASATTVCSSTLQEGDSGSCVSTLQTRLNELGGSLTVDGSFGPATKNAVLVFQGRAELGFDGIVGAQTQSGLDAGSATIGSASAATIDAYIDSVFGSAAPTFRKIASCESSTSEVALNYNTNSTYDIGVFQINTVHGDTAAFRHSMLGYQANVDEAHALYEDSGTSPWNSSKSCWG